MRQIVKRYITMNPKLEAGKDLKIIMRLLTRTSEKNFSKKIDKWHKKYKDFLDDRVPLEGKNKIFDYRKVALYSPKIMLCI